MALSNLELALIKESDAVTLDLEEVAKTYFCPYQNCRKIFHQIADAARHLEDVHGHGEEEGVWGCRFCPNYRTMDLLTARLHVKERHLCKPCKAISAIAHDHNINI